MPHIYTYIYLCTCIRMHVHLRMHTRMGLCIAHTLMYVSMYEYAYYCMIMIMCERR